MSFDKIISIPGLSGLYQMVAQMRNGGFIVESMADGKRQPVSSTQRIIMLKDIAIYTMEEDVPLYEVFKKMKDQDALALSVDPKSDPADLKSCLKTIFPEFDQERVHASDIRKMFSWYKIVKEIIGTPESEQAMRAELNGDAGISAVAPEVAEAVVAQEEAPAKKTTRKKKSDESAAEVNAEATPKKTTRKSTKSSAE